MSYAKLLTALNCTAGPSSFACLQDAPFEVRRARLDLGAG
jgi:hypothetical protein